MGCASSKQSRCRHCKSPYSPVPRSYSMHVHHPPQQRGDSYHVVALTSTTLGSLKLDSSNPSLHTIEESDKNNCNNCADRNGENKSRDFSMSVIEAKSWSNMIDEKIPKIVPKTPTRTPPGEPETINAWEMMEGLEDISPLRPANHFRSFSFGIVPNSVSVTFDRPKSNLQENGGESPKPLWMQMADNDTDSNSNSNPSSKSVISDFDPDVISKFRKALAQLSPAHPFHLKPLDDDKQQITSNDKDAMDHSDSNKVNGNATAYKYPSHGRNKVVVYFTSLRGVRKTYEDCCHVRVILKGLGVRVDERDVSMHSGFKEELKELLGEGFNGGVLPRVFVGGRYFGGAEDIRRMHEEGQLEKALEGCEMEDGDCGGFGVCEACGDIRFVPCETCSGSCKIYYDYDEEEEEEEEDECDGDEYGFRRCPDCNENGIIRCPFCCD